MYIRLYTYKFSKSKFIESTMSSNIRWGDVSDSDDEYQASIGVRERYSRAVNGENNDDSDSGSDGDYAVQAPYSRSGNSNRRSNNGYGHGHGHRHGGHSDNRTRHSRANHDNINGGKSKRNGQQQQKQSRGNQNTRQLRGRSRGHPEQINDWKAEAVRSKIIKNVSADSLSGGKSWMEQRKKKQEERERQIHREQSKLLEDKRKNQMKGLKEAVTILQNDRRKQEKPFKSREEELIDDFKRKLGVPMAVQPMDECQASRTSWTALRDGRVKIFLREKS